MPQAAATGHQDPTPNQLHAQACIVCGTTEEPLLPAGHVYTKARGGGQLGWAVVACAKHREGGR